MFHHIIRSTPSRVDSITRIIKIYSRNLSKSTINQSEFRHSEDLAKERYENRANEDIEKKRARLLYQSRKRGMLENGVILASFADKYLNTLDANQLDQYDRLINLPTNDWDIYYWATKTKPTPEEFETPIMTKLREHLNSKVSNESNEELKKVDDHDDFATRYKVKTEYYGKSRSDELILEPRRKNVYMDPDYSDVSLTNYADELFDDSIIKKGGEYIARMTRWRREYFLKRLKRTISSPVSLRNMIDDDKQVIHGQQLIDMDIAKEELKAENLCDTPYERNMKHHQFMQHLLKSKFTKDALEYDDEAQAWAEMVWHRNYGHSNSKIDPTSFLEYCKTCKEQLHCLDPGLAGYLPIELLSKLKLERDSADTNLDLVCQRCKFLQTYKTSLSLDIPREQFIQAIQQISKVPNSVAIILVDLTDFPSGIWEGLIDLLGHNYYQKILVVGNKMDMLPYDGPGMIRRATESFKLNLSKLRTTDSNLHLHDVLVVSAKTGFNVQSLVAKLAKFTEDAMNMFLIGTANSGKSTLFNSLLQSDLSSNREGDLVSRINSYELSIGSDEVKLLKFPIQTFEGWEIALKEKKDVRVERNYRQMEKSLLNSTAIRQDMPHQSILINHLQFPAIGSQTSDTSLSNVIKKDKPLTLTDDHPLIKMNSNEPLSAEVDAHSGAFHYTPSTTTPDQIHELLTLEEKLKVLPGLTVWPRKYSLRPLQSLFIGGVGRLDLLTATDFIIVTIFASKYLPIHIVDTKRADQFYHTFVGTPYLGVPFGDENRLKQWPNLTAGKSDFHIRSNSWYHGQADITFSSIGWAMISLNPDQECIVRAYTPERRGIYERKPCLVPYVRAKLKQKKIRDTPLFKSEGFEHKQIKI